MADLLHHQVAGEAVCALDDDRADTIALDPLEHRGEAWSGVDRVGAADGRVIVGVDDRKARLSSKRVDRMSLPFLAVLSGDDEPRPPDEPDMVIIARDQARALIPILQAFVEER